MNVKFVEELPDGKKLLECGNCFSNFVDKDNQKDKDEKFPLVFNCPSCKEEVVIPMSYMNWIMDIYGA